MILITGADGQLGKVLKSTLKKNSSFIFKNRHELDITINNKVEETVNQFKINTIVNCAAYTNVDGAEKEKKSAFKVNCESVRGLVELCEKKSLRLIHISTDYVYNGISKTPIVENSFINPQNYYGLSKKIGEGFIEKSNSDSIVIRTSWLYSKYGKNFVKTILKKSKQSKFLKIVSDQFGCPTNAEDLAKFLIEIVNKKERLDKNQKIYNYSNLGYTSWSDFAKFIIKEKGLVCEIKNVKSDEMNFIAKRPKYTITSKKKIMHDFNVKIPNWRSSLKLFLKNNYKN